LLHGRGDLLEGVKVRAERNSATDYIASLDFSFQSKGVRDMLRREGIPFTDEQAPVVTLVPVWLAAGAAKADSAWTAVWSGLDLEHALTPGKLQALKADVTADTVNALLAGDGGAMRALARAYQSELVLLAAAAADPASGRLNVTLTGRDAVGAFTLKRAFRLDRGDPAYTSELAAVVLLGILEGRWKSIRSGTGPGAAGALVREIGVGFRPSRAIALRVIGDFGHGVILESGVLYFFSRSSVASLRSIGSRRFAAFARSQGNDTSKRSASSNTSMVAAAVWPSARMRKRKVSPCQLSCSITIMGPS